MTLAAAELITTGTCPHNCGYCYIPKTEYMKKIHEELVTHLQNGTYIELLKKVYGEDLASLGLWGTEPTLTLPLVADLLPALLDTFPKLKEISFSTAMMANPSIIVNFVKALAKNKAEMKLKIQMSLDGPGWITDQNRMPGASTLIPKNFHETVKQLNGCDLQKLAVEFKWKATHSLENMKAFIGHPEKVHEYVGYFESIQWRFKKLNKNRNVALAANSYLPSLVVPGKYTSEDGKTFARYLATFHGAGFETIYVNRLEKIFKDERELENRHQFSCSGGDSQLGLGPDRIHICHRTFYLDDERYIRSVLNQESSIGDAENWDVSLFRRGTIDFVRDNFIVSPSDLPRFLYVLRGYHDFWRLQLGCIRAMMMELALAGQVDPVWLEDEELSTLFGLFVSTGLSCPMENLLNTGSIHLQTMSLLRMFGNGAFQEILKEIKR